MSLRGVGGGAYGGFNACHYVGDDPVHVAASRMRLADYLGIGVDRLVIPRQTHSLNVAVVGSEADAGRVYNDVDALVSVVPQVALCINTADCVPVIMADTVGGVIGVAHSGWRGTVGRIAARTLDAMVAEGASPANVDVIVGASICPECFEVGEDVAQRFTDEFGGCTDIVIRGKAKPHIDLVSAVRHTLTEAGVVPERIVECGICSRCGTLPLFSARRDGISSGRTLTAAMLKY